MFEAAIELKTSKKGEIKSFLFTKPELEPKFGPNSLALKFLCSNFLCLFFYNTKALFIQH
jgi:hypothetical protein